MAEKVHAYTATYGARGQESTRVKDLVDLVLIADLAELEADRLRHALESTFHARGHQPLPDALPPPPPSWATPYAELAIEVGLGRELKDGYAEAANFLQPILAGRAAHRWDPRRRHWDGGK